MLEQLDNLWKQYTKIEVPELKGLKLRIASSRFKANHFLYPPTQPIGDVRMLSNAIVHCGWECPVNIQWAKGLGIKDLPTSLRELQLAALENAVENGQYPYLWWFYPEPYPKRRAVYVDSIGVCFIKLSGVWQVVYDSKKLGSLVGATGHHGNAQDYEKLPPYAYFVVMENEAAARRHSTG